jgi:hypothetical protein
MGIRVECPNGHVFKVKDKYAGKKGLCPHCKGQVEVLVPHAMTAMDLDEVLQMEAIQRRQAAHHQSATSSGVLDDPQELTATTSGGSGTSGSLLGSSVIRHNIRCKCGEHVPMWYARCPACGEYLEH